MAESNSPLRYPGGKAVLSDFLASTIEANDIRDCVYVEPYAGGAGAALNLLLSGKIDHIILNDADRNIWAFWKAILDHTEAFLDLLDNAPLTIAEWTKQREVYKSPKRHSVLDRGFATFFLNRCNRSGILAKAGVIGGMKQDGKWKMDARFNRVELMRRIERISAYSEQIEIYNLDAVEFIRQRILMEGNRKRFFVYLDPPYFVKGSNLYLNYYKPSDHAILSRFLRRIENVKWLVTYDNATEIRALYHWCKILDFNLHYSAHSSKQGSEILIQGKGLALPLELPRLQSSC